MERKIFEYIRKWKKQGYPIDIPDVVPSEILNLGIAPSYKLICIAILKNDHSMKMLGFEQKYSPWYCAIKRIELKKRGIEIKQPEKQMELF